MKAFNLILVALIALTLSSCALRALSGDYQFGDITRAAIEDLGSYCRATTEGERAAARAAFMIATQLPFPANPCALYERLRSQSEDPVEVVGVGFEFLRVLPGTIPVTATKHAVFL